MKNHSFDDLIKQKALEHEAPVPAGTWEAIAPKKKKKRRFIFLWWVTGAALLSGFILWQSYSKNDFKKSDIAGTAISTEQENRKDETKVPGTMNTNQNDRNGLTAITGKDKQEKTELDGSLRGSDIQVGSTIKDEEKTTSLALSESVKKDKSSSFTTSLQVKKTAASPGLPVKSIVVSRRNKEKEDRKLHEPAIAIHYSADLSQPLNFNDHSGIALFDELNEISLDSADINLLIAKKVDSINAIVSATAIDAKKKIKRNNWTIDVSVTPFLPVQQGQDLLYMTRSNKGSMQESEFRTDRISMDLQPSLSYTVAVYKKLNPRLRIGAGLQYTMVKEKVDLAGIETRITYTEVQRLENGPGGPQLVTDTVGSTSTGALTIDALNSYKFISIPVSAQYTLVQKRLWSMQVNGGVIMNIAARYNNSIEGTLVRFNNNGIHTTRQASSLGFDLFAGLRVSRNYREFRVFAEPILRYNIRRNDLAGMINRKFMHQAGLSLGLSYTFGD